ncbi:MAG: YkgJ family cysteine cluster protein [Desulfurococcaceae archaeon]
MGRIACKLDFINFKEICEGCKENCCRKFYAILLPEEESEFSNVSFDIKTDRGIVKCIGSFNGKPCPYLNEKGFCTVYDKRPFDCRIWPVLIYIDFKTREKVVYLDLECPRVRENRVPREFVEKIISVVKNIEISDEWLEKYTLAPWPNNLIEIARFK